MPKLREVTKLDYCSYSDLREAKRLPENGTGMRRYRVTILTEGKGNPRDKHLYSLNCITDPATAEAFEGKPCFINHADALEEQTRPERSLEHQAGYFSNVQAEGNALKADLTLAIGKQGDELEGFIETALVFSKEHPGQNYCGLSINAAGPTKAVMIDGEEWKQVDRITEAESADAVTKPARGGMFEKKLEAFRKSQESGVEKILKAIRAKAEAGAVDPKDIKRMTDNAISALHGNQPETLEGEKKMTKQALREARKKSFPGMSEEEAKHAAKALAGFHSAEAEDEKDPGKKALKMAAAEKYTRMAGDEAEGEGEGDLTITHKDVDGSDGNGGQEAEGEGEEEAEAKAKKQAEQEAKKKKSAESLVDENKELRMKLAGNTALVESMKTNLVEIKLKESGLPESWFGSLRIMVKGKSLKESQAIIDAEKLKYESTFVRESYQPRKPGVAGGSDNLKESAAVMAEFGL